MKLKLVFNMLLLLVAIKVTAQDLHFSQTDLNVNLRNPAAITLYNATQQLSLSYRSQWSDLVQPYRNITLSYSQKVKKMGWGIDVLHNDAGKASLRTTQVQLKFNFIKRLSAKGEYLSIGANAGLIQQRFNPALFQFDNQYVDGAGFDTQLASGETFLKTNQLLPAFGAGIFLVKYLGRVRGTAGLSFAHLNSPASQFLDTKNEYYPLRTSSFVNAQFNLNEELKTELFAFWNKQSVTSETIAGARLLYEINNYNWLSFGLAKRMKDALILEAGISFKNSDFRLSYDLNNSELAVATNGRGAIELSVVYRFNKKLLNKSPGTGDPMAIANNYGGDKFVKDSDRDGIPDNEDECPAVPGLRQYHGCNDTDRDGIFDSQDACPNLFGDKTNQGCPTNVKDTDGDGLLDDVDKCPFIKGTALMAGCPDSDKDGISDLEDYCPFLKGTTDNNGCPKMKREEHQEFLSTKTISAVVEFDTDQSVIKPFFYTSLDRVIDFMMRHPEAKVYLTGHTDDEGDSAYNYVLGEQRTVTVLDYLIKRGVPFTKISRMSFGETKPVRSNQSAYDKARNRRVEVNVYVE